jgi:hypothetical protein
MDFMSEKERLEERINELEAQLETTQETVRKMLPDRRSFLKLGGAAAGGALLHSATSPAQAQAVGQIGTSSERVDIYAETIDANTAVYDSIQADDNLVVNSVTTDELQRTENATKLSYTGSGQTISSGTVTTVEFDTEEYGQLSGTTVDLANNKITIDAAGTYILKGSVGMSNFGSGRLFGRCKLGSDNFSTDEDESSGTTPTRTPWSSVTISSGSTPIDATLVVFQDTGSDQTTQSNKDRTNLEVIRLG